MTEKSRFSGRWSKAFAQALALSMLLTTVTSVDAKTPETAAPNSSLRIPVKFKYGKADRGVAPKEIYNAITRCMNGGLEQPTFLEDFFQAAFEEKANTTMQSHGIFSDLASSFISGIQQPFGEIGRGSQESNDRAPLGELQNRHFYSVREHLAYRIETGLTRRLPQSVFPLIHDIQLKKKAFAHPKLYMELESETMGPIELRTTEDFPLVSFSKILTRSETSNVTGLPVNHYLLRDISIVVPPSYFAKDGSYRRVPLEFANNGGRTAHVLDLKKYVGCLKAEIPKARISAFTQIGW